MNWKVPQRGHLFCRALARSHQVHVANWVADFSSWQDYFSLSYASSMLYRKSKEGNVFVHRIPRISPALYSAKIRRWNTTIFQYFLRRIISHERIDVVVGTYVVPPMDGVPVVYDLYDDNISYWKSYGRSQSYLREIEENENRYFQKSDSIVAVSSILVEYAQKKTIKPVVLIPNPVELDKFSNMEEELRNGRGKTQFALGVLGNHDKPSELDFLLDAMRRLPDLKYSLIIAGRGKALPEFRKRVERENWKNIFFRGDIAIEDAPKTVQSFDIGLCPYKKTPGADACSPMRLIFYAAAGLPTVCTDLAEVRRMNFENVILVKDSPEAFADGILRAAQMKKQRPSMIEEYDLYRLAARYESALLRAIKNG